jgi:hypothetical protein
MAESPNIPTDPSGVPKPGIPFQVGKKTFAYCAGCGKLLRNKPILGWFHFCSAI